MPFVIGETLGPYRLVEQLGQGGMATVFKAYHAALDRYVAIKVLHIAFMEDHNFLARFQREARVVAKLDHPNIVPIYDFAEHEGRPYLVMKFIEGITLKARMEEGRLPQKEISRVVEQIGGALEYAHQQDVLHRDIKPSNVLVAKDGTLYLTDFGLARMAEAGESSLTADRMVGTPQYMSPEQALSKPDLDARTDIYSFGVMLYEMIVGRVPFNADTPFAIIHDHIYSPLPLPRQVRPDVSAEMERVLLKALAKNPGDRFADIRALMDAYQCALQPAGTILPEEGSPSAGLETAFSGPLPAAAASSMVTMVEPPAAPPLPPQVIETPSSERPKKTRRGWVVACLIGLVVVGIICGLLAFNSAKKARNMPGTVATLQALSTSSGNFDPSAWMTALPGTLPPKVLTQIATNFPTPQVTMLPPEQDKPQPPAAAASDRDAALSALDRAIDASAAGNADAVQQALDETRAAAGKHTEIYVALLERIVRRKAWMVGASLVLDGPRGLPAEFLAVNSPRIHQVLYMAAEDPLAQALFQKAPNDPLLTAALVRNELFFGDANNARKMLDAQSTPVNLRRFPELRLLEAEILAKQGRMADAQTALDTLTQSQTNPPDWVINLAQVFQKKYKP